MLPLTWEDQKPVWFVMAVLIGLSSVEVSGFSRPVRRAFHRPAAGVAGAAMGGRSPAPWTAARGSPGPNRSS
jgi:hypothetical protein